MLKDSSLLGSVDRRRWASMNESLDFNREGKGWIFTCIGRIDLVVWLRNVGSQSGWMSPLTITQ
jgi:hypothetical protein